MYIRQLSKTIEESKKSVLLLGPRQTGKSTLIQECGPVLSINFAREATFLEYASDPALLESQITLKRPATVFIDEVQRLPSILNTVQAILDDSHGAIRFFLTGSSARKLRRGQANLLPGRVISLQLGPLLASEIGRDWNLEMALAFGTLPGVYTDRDEKERSQILSSYAGTYLKEEIQAEALTKDLEGFARFLRFSAASAGQFLDFTRLASEANIKRASSIRFFEVLEDTLIAIRCDAFAKSERRRLIQHPRYFFFDTGVLNGVLGNYKASMDRRGMLFEHLVFSHLYHEDKARFSGARISNYRTEHNAEVDFIVEFPDGRVVAIECKSGKSVANSDLSGFSSFASFFGKPHRKLVIYAGDVARQLGDVEILPFCEGIERVFES